MSCIQRQNTETKEERGKNKGELDRKQNLKQAAKED